MVLNDNLANALSHMFNCEKTGKPDCEIANSKIIKNVLNILKKEGYIEEFESKDEENKIIVKLNGNINKCQAIKPRFSVKNEEYEKYEKRYLPSADIGILIVSTLKGLMTHNQAKKQNLGGRLIAYTY